MLENDIYTAKIPLSTLEVRGLAAWGIFSVDNQPEIGDNITLPISNDNFLKDEDILEEVAYSPKLTTFVVQNKESFEEQEKNQLNKPKILSNNNDQSTTKQYCLKYKQQGYESYNSVVSSMAESSSAESSTVTTSKQKKPLSSIMSDFVQYCQEENNETTGYMDIIKRLLERYITLEENKHELDKKKLLFEIAKFQYINKDFQFN